MTYLTDVKKRRLQELIDAFRTGREERSRERVGRIHLILVEGAPRRDRGEGLVSGRDDGNRVHVFPSMLPDGTELMPGDFAHVLVDRAEGATLVGVALRRAAGAGDRPFVDAETGAEYLVDERTGAARWAAERPSWRRRSARPPVATRAFSGDRRGTPSTNGRVAISVLGIAATGRRAGRFPRVHMRADGRAGAPCGAGRGARRLRAERPATYDNDGDVDDAAAAARRHKRRSALDEPTRVGGLGGGRAIAATLLALADVVARPAAGLRGPV